MSKLLIEAGYEHDRVSNFWRRPGFDSIEYSDGVAEEAHLLELVRSTGDLSSRSEELEAFCADWFTTYHLSSLRSNLLRPFVEILAGSVLEIGAGCGGVSRFLGENARKLIAVEGSANRAKVLRQRTRDLESVTVVVDELSTFSLESKFDVVVVVGVLEYAAMFDDSDDPHINFLQFVRKFLKPEGTLLLAIENRMGLKYFAGAAEDHLAARNVGLEGRYSAGGPATFSRHELDSILELGGFQSRFFHSPVPDYKLPISVVTDLGLSVPDFRSDQISGLGALHDMQLPLDSSFNPLLVWNEARRANLERELSNSFLVESTLEHRGSSALGNLLGAHFGQPRRSAFVKTKDFRLQEGLVTVSVESNGPAGSLTLRAEPGDLEQVTRPEDYFSGDSVLLSAVRDLTSPGDKPIQVAAFFDKWLGVLREESKSCGYLWPATVTARSLVDGRLFDAIPRNAVFVGEKVMFFDQEWVVKHPVRLEELLFRAFLDVVRACRPPVLFQNPMSDVFEAGFRLCGLGEVDFSSLERDEQHRQAQVQVLRHTSAS